MSKADEKADKARLTKANADAKLKAASAELGLKKAELAKLDSQAREVTKQKSMAEAAAGLASKAK